MVVSLPLWPLRITIIQYEAIVSDLLRKSRTDCGSITEIVEAKAMLKRVYKINLTGSAPLE